MANKLKFKSKIIQLHMTAEKSLSLTFYQMSETNFQLIHVLYLLEFVDQLLVHPCTATVLLQMNPHCQLLTTTCPWTKKYKRCVN